MFGFILKRLSLPIVPIIMGIVLGGIMEAKLRIAMARVKTPFDFIDRPIAMALFLFIILIIAFQIRGAVIQSRRIKEAQWSTRPASRRFGMLLSRRRDFLLTERGKRLRAERSMLSRPSTDKD